MFAFPTGSDQVVKTITHWIVTGSTSRESEEVKVMTQSAGVMSVNGNNPMHSSGKSQRVGLLVVSICVLSLYAWAGSAFAAIGFVQGNDVTEKSKHSKIH